MHTGLFIKAYREFYSKSQREMAELLTIGELGKQRLEKWEQEKGSPKENDSELIKRYFDVNSLNDLTEGYLRKLFTELVPRDMPKTNGNGYLKERLDKKNADNPFLVPFVDIPAQAGYAKAYDHVDYIQTLKHYPILPDVDPHGAIWRYFQIQGKSMEHPNAKPGEDYGLRDKETILTSQVPMDDWENFRNLYTYVVVTDTDLWIKDVDREMLSNINKWALISRNPEYAPFTVDIDQVKQLWIMKRHIRKIAPKAVLYDLEKIKKKLLKNEK